MNGTRGTLVERFWAKVDRSGGPDACWAWTAYRNKQGYGQVGARIPDRKAHRFAYELTHGSIPAGLYICHRCDNPPCVNPAHLFLGTPRDNAQDMIRKGRDWRGVPPSGEKHHKAKLTEQQVREIRALSGTMSLAALGAMFGVSKHTAWEIVRRNIWKHIP